MIIADDGGAQISTDAGANWTTYHNQPTAQFYRVITDNHFPYRIYGAQQDNTSVRINSRSKGNAINERDWEPSAGGESSYLAINPLNENIVDGGEYKGYLNMRNHETGEERSVNIWPDNPVGRGAEVMKFRFNWNYPIFYSPHDPKKLYAGSHYLHVTYDGGSSWKVLADYIAPVQSGKQDYIGAFAVTAGIGIEPWVKMYETQHDDYNAILVKALTDRLAEAFAELMHLRVRKEFWGYNPAEALPVEALIDEDYPGIRPAPGYPACPEHTEKRTLFQFLEVEKNTGISLTESCAMYPAAAVSGWYFSHPESKYFVQAIAYRSDITPLFEQWLYDPLLRTHGVMSSASEVAP